MADTRTLTDRARTALIREWAGENGFEVAKGGRIPANIVKAYEAATGAEPAGDDGPDWDAAAAALGDGTDPLADIEGELDAAAGPGTEGERTGLPPPADLDEARARLGGARKPGTPGWAKDTGKAPKDKTPVKVTKAVIGDIEGKLTLLLSGPVAFWQMADPLCGGAAADNLDNMVRKAVPLIIQSPDAVRWFTKGTQFLLWLDLIWAMQPVAQAVYAHHVAATVMLDPRTGQPIPAQRLDDGRIVPAGPGGPAPARPDMSAYTTEVSGHVPPVPA